MISGRYIICSKLKEQMIQILTIKKQSKMATLIKISDDVFEGRHPNGINEGFKKFWWLHNWSNTEKYKFNNFIHVYLLQK
jgi:hypothetical protein